MTSQVQTRESTLKRNLIIHIIEYFKRCPYDTEQMMDITRIAIPIEFATSHPRQEKFDAYLNFYIENGYIDEAIEVQESPNQNSNLVFLRDSYIRYLIARKMKLKKVPIKWYKRGNK